MKGIELPINILVIVAVAVIVLLGIVALYFAGFLGPAGTMTQQSAKSKYCALVVRHPQGCTYGVGLNTVLISDFDANKDGTLSSGNIWCFGVGDPVPACAAASTCGAVLANTDNLASLLQCYFGVTSSKDGLRSCGCAIS